MFDYWSVSSCIFWFRIYWCRYQACMCSLIFPDIAAMNKRKKESICLPSTTQKSKVKLSVGGRDHLISVIWDKIQSHCSGWPPPPFCYWVPVTSRQPQLIYTHFKSHKRVWVCGFSLVPHIHAVMSHCITACWNHFHELGCFQPFGVVNHRRKNTEMFMLKVFEGIRSLVKTMAGCGAAS